MLGIVFYPEIKMAAKKQKNEKTRGKSKNLTLKTVQELGGGEVIQGKKSNVFSQLPSIKNIIVIVEKSLSIFVLVFAYLVKQMPKF